MKAEVLNPTAEPHGTNVKPILRSRLRNLRSHYERPLTARSLSLAAAFHVASFGGLGFLGAADISLAGNSDKHLVMTIANVERRSDLGSEFGLEERVFEVDDARLEEELAELDWVVGPVTDASDDEPEPVPEQSSSETSDWAALPPQVHPQSRPKEPVPQDTISSHTPPETTAVDEEREANPSETPVADVQPLLLEAEPPHYPAIARRKQWEGTTTCRIRVGVDGLVLGVEIEASSGFDALDHAAVEAVSKWRFMPGLRRGIAAEFALSHKVTFRLEPQLPLK
ncbi:MAG: TonB family protein [Planctomycetota bacterium]